MAEQLDHGAEAALSQLRDAVAAGRVRVDDVRHLAAQGRVFGGDTVAVSAIEPHTVGGIKVSVTSVLSYIGALVVVIGIGVLIGQNWQIFDTFTRILSTLGIGVATFVSGTLFMRRPATFIPGIAFHIIAAVTITIGVMVSFHEYGIDLGDIQNQNIIALIIAMLYLCAFILFRHTFFLICLILSGSWLFMAASALVPAANDFALGWQYGAYRVLVLGLSYLLLAHGLMTTQYRSLRGVLFAFGSIFFLSSTFALGGWATTSSLFWETAFPFIIAGFFFLSVRLQQRQLLLWPTLFLMAYIMKITSEYFSDSLGWPVTLILAGFALIGVGFLSFWMRKKYFGTK